MVHPTKRLKSNVLSSEKKQNASVCPSKYGW